MAAVIIAADIVKVRQVISSLRMPGQRRIHFTKESDQRRRRILSTLERLELRVWVYHVTGRREREARATCLAAIAAEVAANGITRVVLERDDSIVEQDRRTLYQELETHGARERVSYRHATAAEEPLLCIPDAIAWSFARGGEWRRRIDPMIDVTQLP